jgi:hypothetical protein
MGTDAPRLSTNGCQTTLKTLLCTPRRVDIAAKAARLLRSRRHNGFNGPHSSTSHKDAMRRRGIAPAWQLRRGQSGAAPSTFLMR